MRLGIVSDIHSNHAGLARALELMGPVDELLCLGDCIFDYRFCNETVGLLRERGAITILGNHEEAFFSPGGERARTQDWIDRDHLAWLASRPREILLEYGETRVLMVHSTPWQPRGEYIMPKSPKLERFAEADADIVLYGHTHHQVVRQVEDVLVVNPGSTGDGRDARNDRQLSFAVVDTATRNVSIVDFPDPKRAAGGPS